MHALPHDHTGNRIARLRTERQLTQKELQELSSLPISTVQKTEQGLLPLTPHVAACFARALRVSVATIVGQPYENELRADNLDALIHPIREALDVYDLGADPEINARDTAELHAQAERLCAAVRGGEIKTAASDVAGLIQEAASAAHEAATRDGWLTLASLYRTSYDVAAKLGFPDLAALSLARLDWAAQRGSDAVLGGIYQYLRALTHLREGQYRTGQRLITLGLSVLQQAEPSPERQVVTGQLHLGAAVMAGRTHDEELAHAHLSSAEQIAAETGEAASVHWLAFGPTNVKVHRVSVLAELDQYGDAVEASAGIAIPRDWPKSRTSHHYAELARAEMWTGNLDSAFRNLQKARQSAPQQAKYHPTVRDTYEGLEAAHRQFPESFLSFGSWLRSPR
ncbi:helix-turn-helix domain-containing protein (plasmid) [Streptomyces sp. NBC_01724]|uniref:helix-turn-helix domain-containing protein n=1 Tax=Streptomyces sp. NBC_01724 TaxID=2975922 RepID=UPI002E380B4A|nr:helix-turn-helix transcriptional regulator [Streptomyces sp. NBC_01724]